VIIGATHEAAQAKVEMLKARGVTDEALTSAVIGDPDAVGERVQALKEIGLEGYGLSMADAHDLEAVELVGRTLAPIFAS
jgi:alkanesulfonate monooxygenase SsuD/methylene tetrahydromethanopterin reductase-like flavin-dependent oxidoreductase (luciferase family)